MIVVFILLIPKIKNRWNFCQYGLYSTVFVQMGGKFAHVRRYFYMCPLDYAKWATHYGLLNSSWAKCPQMEGHWKKKKYLFKCHMNSLKEDTHLFNLYFISLGRPLFGLLYQPRMIDEYGALGGMIIGRGNRSTWRKPALVLVCLPIPHVLTWDRTRRLTAWAMAWPRQIS
jgi:hypothetical protein